MNRFIYYLILVNMITNIVATIPKLLLSSSKDGAITSMIAGVFVGLIFTAIIIRFFNRFPGQDLPTLMKKYTPKWYYYPVLICFSIIWYLAGTLTLVTFTFILVTFLSPEMAVITMLLPFLIIISFGVLMKTQNVLYSTEIIFILLSPLAIFTFIKAYGSSNFNWDFVKVAMMHVNHLPTYHEFTASLFLFTGVLNLAVFNRFFVKKQTFGIKQLTIVGLIAFFTLFTMYFMPIGFGGFDKISSLLYPWISTTDSVRMKFGLIERLVFIFMLYFVSIALMSMTIHWHTSAQLLGSIINFKRLKLKKKNLTPYVFVLSFTAVAIILSLKLTEYHLYKFAGYLYDILPIFLILFLLTLWLIKRGAKT